VTGIIKHLQIYYQKLLLENAGTNEENNCKPKEGVGDRNKNVIFFVLFFGIVFL
jgi:hypothetical protein